MIAFERLAQLALAELPEEEARAVEDHVLGCDGCAAVLERLLDLGDGVREATAAGSAFLLAGRGLVERLERGGMVTRRYEIPAGGSVACTVDAHDIYSSLRLHLDARGVRRLDMFHDSPKGRERYVDLPFDPASGDFVFVQPGDYLRTLPTGRATLRLVSVEETGDRLLAEYVLNHTGYTPR